MTDIEKKENIEKPKEDKKDNTKNVLDTGSPATAVSPEKTEKPKKAKEKAVKPKKGSKKKKRRNVIVGIVHIQAGFNNTVVSISDLQGNTIAWSSAGKMGFKGSRKSTPYAAQLVTKDAVDKAKECGLQSAKVEIKGPGMGRESSLRALAESRLGIISIEDVTFHPHNGCRAKKKRRV